MLNKLPDMFASVESLIGTAGQYLRIGLLVDGGPSDPKGPLARLKAEEERRICAEEARKAARLQEEFEKQIEEYRQTGAIYGDGNGSASSAEARPRNDAVSPSAPHTVWQKGKAALLGDRVALPTPAADPLSELDDFLKDVDKDEVLASTPRRSGTDGNCDSSPRQDVMIAKDEDYADDGSLQ
ncbi:MAG: hypothetical protein BJ554DRAFT_792 [Olpidium bornovanus]|uniref:Uncharacterized protein n=1 Tax=Olpidium bornovanus TaxID=278681 RepID=A0A8H7ZTE6_9FUNG|nr:MAG: hypothetical protein BJ554DRAFT_792 [Olpidium bornovanus]